MLSSMPRVSIVTPSFNQAQFLEQTMRSILGQDYPEIEYIVIDGGSTDGSVELIRRHERELAYWVSERDSGQSAAINKGFARATGEILAWVNSDDLLAPSAVRLAVAFLADDAQVGLIYGDRLHIDARGNVIGINRMPAYYPVMLRRNITLPQETVFFRRDAFHRAGGLDETLKFSMDFDLWCRMAKVTSLRHIPAFLGLFREHDESKSMNAAVYEREHEEVFARYFGRKPPRSAAARVNRMMHQMRLALEWREPQRKVDLRRIRAISEAASQPKAALAISA
jgi:glycosyltransferase involved in cell wall biosynthesis